MTTTKTLLIDGMDCPSCTAKIEGIVCKIPGVDNVKLNYTNQKLKFDFDEKSSDAGLVVKAVEKLGYKVNEPGQKAKAPDLSWWQTGKGRLVIASGALLALAAILSYQLPEYAG